MKDPIKKDRINKGHVKLATTILLAALLLAACGSQAGPTPNPGAPTIAHFGAEPATVTAGGTSTLSWQVEGATSLELTPGIGPVTGTSVAVSPAQTTTYVLTATNAAGSVTNSTTVTVTSDNPDDPGDPAGTARFFLPTGEPDNTTAPTVATDAQGGIHMVYPAYAIGDAYYAYCPADCNAAEDVSVVKFATDGTVANVMIALDANGTPQVLMSAYYKLYYATCGGDCTQASAWTVNVIMEHEGDREVSGEAFALDPEGRPRFIMHAYRAYLGVGQPTPVTWYVSCDGDCHDPAGWQTSKISDQIWQESTLLFTAAGQPRVATVVTVEGQGGAQDTELAAYFECNADCTGEDSWVGIGLYHAFSDRYIERIDPAISLALTTTDAPRLLVLGKDDAGARLLVYFECEADCTNETGATWTGNVLINSDDIGAGLDLALDGQNRPRFAYTADYNILLGYCDGNCMAEDDSTWALAKVEMGSDMPPDEVIPYPNCTVTAWFLQQPSLGIGIDGLPRVAYQAMDISGGWDNPDPTDPDCVAGLDMTFSRFTQLSSFTEE